MMSQVRKREVNLDVHRVQPGYVKMQSLGNSWRRLSLIRARVASKGTIVNYANSSGLAWVEGRSEQWCW